MDCNKVGQLILQLRKEKGLTQRSLAEQLGISNKTVSKWECGGGAPDVSVWNELSSVLGADILKLLEGELAQNSPDIGKIDRIKFYVCSKCGNILTSTGKASVSCCGRRLSPLVPFDAAEKQGSFEGPATSHIISSEITDMEYYINVNHEMTKEHYISFAAYVCRDRFWFMRLYPEQSPEFRMPIMRGGSLYLYCVKDGLFRYGCL